MTKFLDYFVVTEKFKKCHKENFNNCGSEKKTLKINRSNVRTVETILFKVLNIDLHVVC